MWLLLASAAFAAPSPHTCAADERLDEVIYLASYDEPPILVEIQDGCITTDIDHLEFPPVPDGALDWTLKGAAIVDVPPIRVTDGATLTLQDIRIPTTSALMELPPIAEALFSDALVGVAVVVHEATLHVDGLKLVGASGGAGLLLVDGAMDGSAFVAEQYSEYRALYAVGEGVRTTVSLTGATFERNGAGAVALWGDGQDVQAHFLDSPIFEDNGPAPGADIATYDVFDTTVVGGHFTRSEGVSGLTFRGAPISIEGGSFSCDTCTFVGTRGETASVADVAMDAGDAFTWTNGGALPGSAVEPALSVDRAGDVTLDSVDFGGAGQLFLASDTVRLTNVRLDGQGGYPDHQAIKFSFTDATIDGLRACNYADNGWGLIASYGSRVTMRNSRLQSLALGGNPILRDWQNYGSTFDLQDNTFVASDAVIVTGNPADLTFVNNLVANTSGGIAIDTVASGMVIDYNLWSSVSELGTTTGSHDLFEDDPRFVSTYDAADCLSEPELAEGSPANAKGDPARQDDYGNARSDIGAWDFDDEGGPDDTGGDTDIVPDDTGAPDDTADPDTDLDTDGDTGAPLGLVGGALPPCACGSTSGGAWLGLAGLALLVRRRR